MTDLVKWLHRNADDCEDQSRWATPELAPFLREAATALEAKEKEIAALRERVKDYETAYDGLMKAKETFRAEAHRNAARAETAERELDVLSSSHRDLAKRLAAMGRERDQARAALKLLTPGHRAPGCWCSYGRDIDRSDHEIGCRAARAITGED